MNHFGIPREISWSHKFQLFFFHNTRGIIGLIFILISGLLILFFFPYIDFSDFYINENSPKAKGIIIDIVPTSIKEGTERIYKYYFYYVPNESSKTYTVISYGKNPARQKYSGLIPAFKQGDTVDVIYSEEHREIAKIKDMDFKPAPLFLLIFMLVPLTIGIILLLSQIPGYQKTLQLIREGVIGEALFISMSYTNIKINGSRVMKLLFRYKTKAGEYEFTYRTNHPEPYRNPQLKHPILYDPENPNKAILIWSLPKKIRELIIGQT
jgi:hypothetical protein